jgi:protein ImuA
MAAPQQPSRTARLTAIAALRDRLEALGRAAGAVGTGPVGTGPAALPSTGLDALDRQCRDGLPAGIVHEMWAGPGARPAAAGFALSLAATSARRRGGDLVWVYPRRTVQEWGLPYGPGVMALGHDPDRFLLIEAGSTAEALWACEEALKAAGTAAAIVALDQAYGRNGLGASRRLELAARAGGRCAFLLCSGTDPPPSAASLRWQVAPLAGPEEPGRGIAPFDALFPPRARWQVALTRNRWGRTGRWTVEWDHGLQRLDTIPAPDGAVAAPLAGRAGQGAGEVRRLSA